MDTKSSVEQLEAQVSLSPYDEKCYLPLLTYYQDRFDNDDDDDDATARKKFENLRVQFALHCNPSLSFWMSWLMDVVIHANKDSSCVKKVCGFYPNYFN